MGRVLCIYEDRAFEDVVTPLIRRILPSSTEITERRTAGCRIDNLNAIINDLVGNCCALVIGADCGGLRGADITRKRQLLTANPRIAGLPTALALPKPSVEAWLLTNPTSLRTALTPHSSIAHPRLPERLPRFPTSEQQAKKMLADLSSHMLGFPALRGGVEYGPEVISLLELEDISNNSLRSFVTEARNLAGQIRR